MLMSKVIPSLNAGHWATIRERMKACHTDIYIPPCRLKRGSQFDITTHAREKGRPTLLQRPDQRKLLLTCDYKSKKKKKIIKEP